MGGNLEHLRHHDFSFRGTDQYEGSAFHWNEETFHTAANLSGGLIDIHSMTKDFSHIFEAKFRVKLDRSVEVPE